MTSPLPDDLLAPGHGEEDGESWLTSYLDVLTLLTTLFELLLALSDSGIQPRHTGLLPQLDGVSVSRSQEGLNLRIQDHLLFTSGQATLTEADRRVLRGVLPLLDSTAGTIRWRSYR